MPEQDTLVRSLDERFRTVNTEITEILERAVNGKRELSAEERLKVDGLSTERAQIKDQADEVTRHHQLLEETRKVLDELGALPSENMRGLSLAQEFAANLRAVAAGKSTETELRARITAPGSRVRALGVDVTGGGRELVPVDFAAILIRKLTESLGIFKAGVTTITTSRDKWTAPRVITDPTAVWVEENTTIGGTAPTFDTKSIELHKAGILLQVANELLNDDATDLLTYLAEAIANALQRAVGSAMVSGNGTGKPFGIVGRVTTGVTGAGNAATAEELLALKYSVAEHFANAPDAAWLVNRTYLGQLRALKDASGRFLYNPAVTVTQPDVFDGNPLYSDSNVAAPAAGAKSVLFGDFSGYYQLTGNAISFARSDEFAFDKDQATFRGLVRVGGDLVIPDSVKAFQGKAA
ncbi:phage major capsid protein [Cellulomonas timonensis]|uniref:phage major capsid protein n=1 Tax=Cellulomonas timonensis TaxID=1689271 RepID=UPI000835DC34|nr:phage major capsid protein [Cellulomonas timonensis]